MSEIDYGMDDAEIRLSTLGHNENSLHRQYLNGDISAEKMFTDLLTISKSSIFALSAGPQNLEVQRSSPVASIKADFLNRKRSWSSTKTSASSGFVPSRC